jgi:hypothetical protein
MVYPGLLGSAFYYIFFSHPIIRRTRMAIHLKRCLIFFVGVAFENGQITYENFLRHVFYPMIMICIFVCVSQMLPQRRNPNHVKELDRIVLRILAQMDRDDLI